MRKRAIIGGVAIIAVVAAFITTSLVLTGNGGVSELEGVEVREYQGQDLSSINDFRKNSIHGTQKVDLAAYRLDITGLVDTPISYTYDEVLDHDTYKKVVRLNCVEGWAANILWEGVQVRDLISEAGLQHGAVTVIFHAADGYTTSFPVDYIMDNPILLAYRMNEITMPAERGFPFQLVAESKWGYKWIKWVTQIELSDDAEYEGYWESRGYSNTADLDKGFFD